jgi:tRNA-specific 2-thiouridylase
MQSVDGAELGTHQGLMYYTIGQRQGLGIGGAGEPWYVAGKDVQANRLLLAQGHDHPTLYRRELVATQLSWVAGHTPASPRIYAAKTRYRQADARCALVCTPDDRCNVAFDEAQWAVTPGQSVVVYDGDVCLGGGIIE